MKCWTIFFLCFYLPFLAQFAVIEKYRNDTLIEKTYFDTLGRMTEKVERIIKPSLYMVLKTKNIYSSNGLLASTKIMENEREILSIDYLYDDKLRLVRSKYYSHGKYQGKEVALYENDLLVKEIRFGQQHIEWEKEYIYDQTGQLSKKITRFYHDSILTRELHNYFFWVNGYLVQDSSITSDGVQQVTTFFYDKTGRLLKKMVFWGTNDTTYFVYKYKRKHSLPVYEIEKYNGYIMHEIRRKYNRNGYLIKEKSIDYRNFKGNMHPIKVTYSYKYYRY